jgi:hypothetical protein
MITQLNDKGKKYHNICTHLLAQTHIFSGSFEMHQVLTAVKLPEPRYAIGAQRSNYEWESSNNVLTII